MIKNACVQQKTKQTPNFVLFFFWYAKIISKNVCFLSCRTSHKHFSLFLQKITLLTRQPSMWWCNLIRWNLWWCWYTQFIIVTNARQSTCFGCTRWHHLIFRYCSNRNGRWQINTFSTWTYTWYCFRWWYKSISCTFIKPIEQRVKLMDREHAIKLNKNAFDKTVRRSWYKDKQKNRTN